MSIFGFKKYFTAGVISSAVLFLLGMHTIIHVAIAMIFRLVVGAIIAAFGRNAITISVAGPLATLTARLVLSLVLQLTLPPINEWGSKVQKISSLLSHQPMLLVGYNTKTLSYFL